MYSHTVIWRPRGAVAFAGALLIVAAGHAPAEVTPVVETAPMGGSGDVADGVCVWVHPTDRSKSVVLGANKSEDRYAAYGGLYAFGLDGDRYGGGPGWQPGVDWFADGKKINVADVGYGFRAGEERWDIVCLANRTGDTIDVFRIEADAGGDLAGMTQVGAISPSHLEADYPYGIAMLHAWSVGKHFVIVSDKDGLTEQFELGYDGQAGGITGVSVWHGDVSGGAGEVEGIVADNDREVVYIASENTRLYRYGTVDGAIQGGRVVVDDVAGPALAADIEGLAMYYGKDGAGYLIASSQGSDEFAVYDREYAAGGANPHVLNFEIGSGEGIDSVRDTDGIYVISTALGGAFDDGIFIAHDGTGDSPTTYKFVGFDDVADEGAEPLTLYRHWDPRAVPTWVPRRWRGMTAGWFDTDNWTHALPDAEATLSFAAAPQTLVNLQGQAANAHQILFAHGADGYSIFGGLLRMSPRDGMPPRIEHSAAGGSNEIATVPEAPGLNVAVTAGRLTIASLVDANTVRVGGTLALTGFASDCQRLVLEPNGLLDLAAPLLVREGSAAELTAEILEGHNGGAWDGETGITSSLIPGDPRLAVALIDTDDGVLIDVALLGDGNLDGHVDHTDYLTLKANLGTPASAGWLDGDYDYDGDVDRLDLGVVEGNFGETVSFRAQAQVPEPTSALLLLSCAIWVLRRRKR